MLYIDYYYNSPDTNHFISFRTLFTEDFKQLSVESKALYALMLERANLSNRNHWVDSENKVYIIFTAKQIMNEFQCSERTALKLLKELDEFGLIERQRTKIGQPCLIYVKILLHTEACVDEQAPDAVPAVIETDVTPAEVETDVIPTDIDDLVSKYPQFAIAENTEAAPPETPAEKYTVATSKNCSCHLQNMQLSNINSSNINYSISNISYLSYLYQKEKQIDVIDSDSINNMRDFIKENIDYDILTQNSDNQEDIDNIVEIITDVLTSKKPMIRIAGEYRPIDVVKSVYSKLDMFDIQYVCECMSRTTTKIVNIVAYIRTALYKAKQTINLYYANKVHHDMAYNWK